MSVLRARESNFELLRIISILMIQAMHIVGLIHKSSDITFLNVQVESLINIVCNTGVSCFILISGWYGIKRKFNKFVNLLLHSIVYSIICAAMMKEIGLMSTFVRPIWTVLGYGNWFIGCYFVVYILSPYLNSIVEEWPRERLRNMLVTLVIIIGFVTTLLHAKSGAVIYQGGKCIIWFMTVYLIGRYMRKYFNLNPSKDFILKIILLPLGLMFALRFAASLLPAPFNDTHNYLERDASPLILLASIGIFYAFKRLRLQSRVINYLAGSVFAVYLIGWGG